MIFRNRREAGRVLARRLRRYAHRGDVVVLAVPRGGAPVAFEVALALDAPLDVFSVRKLGVLGNAELAMGAIASGGVRVLDEDIIEALHIPDSIIDSVTAREQHELERRERLYRDGRRALEVRGRIVILVDDGLATGSTMRAAVTALRKQDPAALVVAVPVASVEAFEAFQQEVDECVCGIVPEPFYDVGAWYGDFSQTEDFEVRELLERLREARKMPVGIL